MRFEWDEGKNLVNQRKHKVSFELAREVFLDPLHRSIPDEVVDSEQRWQMMRLVGGVVPDARSAHMARRWWRGRDPDHFCRKATRKERRDYERG